MVTVNDTMRLLSKAQKEKIRKKLKENTSISGDEILNSIHYSGNEKYNKVDIDTTGNETVVTLIYEESRRNILKKKLNQKIQERSSTDPKWVMYRQLKSRGIPDLPTPDDISSNKSVMIEQIEQMKRIMPSNPFITYLETCVA